MRESFWRDRKVLITGNSGFKGAWLSLWLHMLGAKILGWSHKSLGPKSLYECANLSEIIENKKYDCPEFNDILDFDSLTEAVRSFNPSAVFHLAAQPLVLKSYQEPKETYHVNALGTLNILEAAKQAEALKAIISVTTDKVYRNNNTKSGYKEYDPLGGIDPYSASKASADILTQSYFSSFYKPLKIGVSSVRAGNVIGGGDWSAFRLVPDIYRSVLDKQELILRHPQATRPWQFVLEPLSGYILLAENLINDPLNFSTPFNFGPNATDVLSVKQVVDLFNQKLNEKLKIIYLSDPPFHEAQQLSLDCKYAKRKLGWSQKLTSKEAIMFTAEWYSKLRIKDEMRNFSRRQIEKFIEYKSSSKGAK